MIHLRGMTIRPVRWVPPPKKLQSWRGFQRWSGRPVHSPWASFPLQIAQSSFLIFLLVIVWARRIVGAGAGDAVVRAQAQPGSEALGGGETAGIEAWRLRGKVIPAGRSTW
jgi:hypothetical protein